MLVAQQVGHEGIGLGDFARAGVENEHPVLRRFKKPAVANFRAVDFLLGLFALGDVHDHRAALLPVGQALGLDVHGARRLARAHQLEIPREMGPARKDLLEKGMKLGTCFNGQQPGKGPAHQPRALPADEHGAGEIDQPDGAVGGEREIAHGREFVEIGVLLQRNLQIIPDSLHLDVLHLQFHLMHLQFVELPLRVGFQNRPPRLRLQFLPLLPQFGFGLAVQFRHHRALLLPSPKLPPFALRGVGGGWGGHGVGGGGSDQ